MNKTSIQWTDFTANPLKFRAPDGRVVWACEKISPGCKNCYAEHLSTRYGGVRRAGEWNAATMATLTPFLDEKELRAMLSYKPASGKRVFVGDMTDLFGSWVSDELLDRLFAVFALRRDVTHQVLTKRADRARAYLASRSKSAQPWKDAARALGYALEWQGLPLVPFPLPNVWIGVSVEDQQRADERIPSLLQTPAAVRFISAEPLLESTDLHLGGGFCRACGEWTKGTIDGHCFNPALPCFSGEMAVADGIDWVIVGGESGHSARPCDRRWIYRLIDQCQAASVPIFVKQLGARSRIDGITEPDRLRLRDSHGGDPSEWAPYLRIRQFPKTKSRTRSPRSAL